MSDLDQNNAQKRAAWNALRDKFSQDELDSTLLPLMSRFGCTALCVEDNETGHRVIWKEEGRRQ